MDILITAMVLMITLPLGNVVICLEVTVLHNVNNQDCTVEDNGGSLALDNRSFQISNIVVFHQPSEYNYSMFLRISKLDSYYHDYGGFLEIDEIYPNGTSMKISKGLYFDPVELVSNYGLHIRMNLPYYTKVKIDYTPFTTMESISDCLENDTKGYYCNYSKMCIPHERRCDGGIHCTHMEDEKDCLYKPKSDTRTCTYKCPRLKCKDGSCVSSRKLCTEERLGEGFPNQLQNDEGFYTPIIAITIGVIGGMVVCFLIVCMCALCCCSCLKKKGSSNHTNNGDDRSARGRVFGRMAVYSTSDNSSRICTASPPYSEFEPPPAYDNYALKPLPTYEEAMHDNKINEESTEYI